MGNECTEPLWGAELEEMTEQLRPMITLLA